MQEELRPVLILYHSWYSCYLKCVNVKYLCVNMSEISPSNSSFLKMFAQHLNDEVSKLKFFKTTNTFSTKQIDPNAS